MPQHLFLAHQLTQMAQELTFIHLLQPDIRTYQKDLKVMAPHPCYHHLLRGKIVAIQ